MFRFFFIIICLYAATLLFLYFVQRQLIYFPSSFSPTPSEAGVSEMQTVTLHTTDGLSLKAWYCPSIQAELPTLIYFHGNAGNIGNRGQIIQPFLKHGFGVLLTTYRGYSGNPGNPNESDLYKDARAAFEFLKNQNVTQNCTVLYGESLGTAIAIQMAIEYTPGATILQSPFTSLGDLAQYHYPFFPVRWLIKDHYRSLEKVKQIKIPVLVLYAAKDDIVPPDFSISLFEALPATKQIQAIPDIGHNDLFNPSYAINFIKKYVNNCNITPLDQNGSE
ncbi:MAG: alpha/beta hydrolase [Candidatus Protochlamydia sp.]|nr:alpha/beta hydrolase [Candidatus Protochlamydia sp.]